MKVALICLALWLVAPAVAEARTLHWQSLAVNLRVDAEGRLLITERHAMVFDGDWNGGERTFQLRPWHRLHVESVTEIVPDSVERIALHGGDLDAVNEYNLTKGRVLRWRSRLPSDPPFQNALKIYEIAYVIEGALVPAGDGYVLNHDLAFPERSAEIERFDATLELAPEWQSSDLPRTVHREHLVPGESVFVDLRLQYVGSGKPSAVASVHRVASTTGMPALRYGAVVLVLAFAVWSLMSWLRSERARGRFEPHIALDSIDEQWLAQNVFCMKPEAVGAAWDRNTSAAEVAALIARLTQEGKLASTVDSEGLRLSMLCERDTFDSHERPLIDRLFFDGRRVTDTAAIRSHYKSSGLNPAHEIAAPLRNLVPAVFGSRVSLPAWRIWITALGMLAGGALLVTSWVFSPDTAFPTVMWLIALVVLYGVGLGFAYAYSGNVHDLQPRIVRALIVPSLLSLGLAYVLLAGPFALVTLDLIAFPLLTLGALNSLFNRMHSRETPKGMQLRRALGSARKYFLRELAAEQPRIKDEWFPYLLAFGLGEHIDRWFKSFGGTSRAASSYFPSTSSSSSPSGGSSTWTGGGGQFSGAGASGSWAAAVAGVAAGVATPSSNGGGSSGGGGGSSSGGGGSSSSGGGGGGGW